MAHRSLIKLIVALVVLSLLSFAPRAGSAGLVEQALADGGPLVYQLDFSCSVNQVGNGLMQVSSDAANTGTVTLAVDYYPDATTRTGGVDTGTPHLSVTLTGAGDYPNLAFPGPIPSQYLTGGYFLRVSVVAVTGTVNTASVGVNGDLLSGCAAPPTQTIAGHIYDCTSGSQTTNEVLGGTLGATGPQTVATQSNPLNPTQVAAGAYTMSATAPSGYHFVTCGGTATVGSPPTSATESVTVPSGGAGVGIFYVAQNTQITQTIAGHIYLCSSGTPTTTEVTGGTLGATGPQTVATQGNPLNPTSVAAGAYTMSAGAPTGYQFVSCGGSATIGSPPTSATESVTVPSGGQGVGIFYVAAQTTGQAGGCSPGYWKNHLRAWNGAGYAPSQSVASVFNKAFGPEAGESLLTALQTGGGTGLSGAEDTLLRSAVGALLNASTSGMNYPLTQSQVINQVNTALASGNRDTMLNVGGQLDKDNNLEGPLC